jgi:HSP20 family protein
MYWDPFEDMKRMQADMERNFKRMMQMPAFLEFKKHQKEFPMMRQPLADIKETKNNILVNVEMPGVEKKDIAIKLTETTIDIKAEKKQEHEMRDEKKGYYHQERSYKGFHRFFTLPAPVDTRAVVSELKNGVLHVVLKKKQQKTISVKTK